MFTLPLGLDARYEQRPFGTVGLIVAMGVVHVLTLGVGPETLRRYYFDPQDVTPWQSITSALLHGGDRVAQSYHELTQSEAAWRMVEQHLRKQNRVG